MNYRRSIWLAALGLILALVCVAARAAESKFSLNVQADGVTLGTAAATLTVTASTPTDVTWKLSDGVFTASANPDGKLKYDDAMLNGTGKAKSTGTATLKDFDITVEQNTGVDVTYRFRISANLADGAVKSVSIEQLK
jgi:hypothetical protein